MPQNTPIPGHGAGSNNRQQDTVRREVTEEAPSSWSEEVVQQKMVVHNSFFGTPGGQMMPLPVYGNGPQGVGFPQIPSPPVKTVFATCERVSGKK
ncbi:hypothetical protein OAN22_01285 [Alphaproteobacteria bacterium]|nr:hypothetical protein [Alphaproteobacteria bacterium]